MATGNNSRKSLQCTRALYANQNMEGQDAGRRGLPWISLHFAVSYRSVENNIEKLKKVSDVRCQFEGHTISCYCVRKWMGRSELHKILWKMEGQYAASSRMVILDNIISFDVFTEATFYMQLKNDIETLTAN